MNQTDAATTAEIAVAPTPAKSGAGLLFGIVALIFGLISLLLLAMFFGTFGFIAGVIAIIFSLRRKYFAGMLLGGLGLVFSTIGLATSPFFWMAVGGATMGSAIVAHTATAPPKARPNPVAPAKPVIVAEAKIEGAPRVLTSSTLMVDGKRITLAGVADTDNAQAKILQDFLGLQGNHVSCVKAAANAYVCKTPKGIDVGEAAILNGAAKAASGSSDAYRQRQEEARTRHAGIWAN